MKPYFLASLAAAAFSFSCGVAGAGPLDPPGPPGPVFKTLHEIEPRTNLGGEDAPAALVISVPGSYYLADNIQAQPGSPAITINASPVTLDLNGFSVRGNPGDEDVDAIHVKGHAIIRNGIVTNAGGTGIGCSNAGGERLELVHVSASDNGNNGASCSRLRVLGGEFSNNQASGLTSLDLHADGVRADNNGSSGIIMNSGSMATRSTARSNAEFGFFCVQGTSLVSQSLAKFNGTANMVGCVVFDSLIP